MKSNIENKLNRKVGKAINQYSMIEAGDKVLIGVSGGKDSLSLLRILCDRLKWLPIKYEVTAVHVINDYDLNKDKKKEVLSKFFNEIGCKYLFEEIKIKEKNKKKEVDCFWCAWNRRKTIFKIMERDKFTKVAFGHHKDDVVETILMNMFWTGHISSINPVQELFEGKVKIIRPLIFCCESEMERYAKEKSLPVIESICPKNKNSKRAIVKGIIEKLAEESQDIKTNILRAPSRVRSDYISDISES